MNKKRKIILIVLSVIVVLVASRVISYSIKKAEFNEKVSFTTEKWQTISPELKYYMAKDFLDNYDVIGMSQSDIISYLGEPTKIYEKDGITSIYYDCGTPKMGFVIDPFLMLFKLENDKVIATALFEC